MRNFKVINLIALQEDSIKWVSQRKRAPTRYYYNMLTVRLMTDKCLSITVSVRRLQFHPSESFCGLQVHSFWKHLGGHALFLGVPTDKCWLFGAQTQARTSLACLGDPGILCFCWAHLSLCYHSHTGVLEENTLKKLPVWKSPSQISL